MSVLNGMIANQTTFNNAFMSRTAAVTSTVAKLQLSNPASTAVDDAQKYLGKLGTALGITEISSDDTTYSNTNYIVNGEGYKRGIERLDARLFLTQTQLDILDSLNSNDVILDAIGSTPNVNGATLTGQVLNLEPASASFGGIVTTGTQSIAGNKTFLGDVIVTGSVEVRGTRTFVNTATVDSLDPNITLNKGGTNGSAEGSGISVERVTGGNFSAVFDSTLASIFKVGIVGSENEVVVSGPAQTIVGTKTFSGAISASNLSGTNTGDVTLGVIGSTPNVNGATLTGQVLNLEPASASFGGIVTTGPQTFSGEKDFSNSVQFQSKVFGDTETNSVATGTNAALTNPNKLMVLLTNTSLISILSIAAASVVKNQNIILVNKTTSDISIINSNSNAGEILTGTGSNIILKNNAALNLSYDSINLRWVISGVGSYTIPVAQGGTGQTTQVAAFNALSPSTSKGDLITNDGIDDIAIGVGADGQVLTADSTQTSGLKWAASSGGSSASPTGAVMDFAGATAPTGWLMLDGSLISRVTYAALFAVISTTYGVGDGVTTFALPDLRGRSSIGAGTGTGLSARSIGQSGGEEVHFLSINEIPSHSHLTNIGAVNSSGGSGVGAGTALVDSATGLVYSQTGSFSNVQKLLTNTQGAGASHNNMHPYLVLNKIIKT